MGSTQITTTGIKKLLKKYNMFSAICEYIWNGFDAEASRIDINYTHANDDFKRICSLSIQDNGKGIHPSLLNEKFKPFYESEKAIEITNPKNQSAMHGKNGVGRLTFFHFATEAEWLTHSQEDNGSYVSQKIKIKADNLINFFPETIDNRNNKTGTNVTFYNISDLYEEKVTQELIPFICNEFCWFLELNKERKFEVYINNALLDYSEIIEDIEELQYTEQETNNIFNLKYICWKKKLHKEFSKFYFLNSNHIEMWKANTSLNNKGDEFHHSLYIQSKYFDDFSWERDDSDNNQPTFFSSTYDDVYKKVMQEAHRILYNKRRPYIKNYTLKLIEKYEEEGVFPEFDNSILGQFKKSKLEETVRELYQIQPQIFTGLNICQKKSFIGLLNIMLDLGDEDKLLEIISKVVEMSKDDREALADILQYTSMSSITKTINLIKDRFKTVAQLKEMVFDETLKANERDHLQKVIENHYWLFGEQYNLVTAEEPKFEEALRRYNYYLHGVSEKVFIDNPDKYKEMDIFTCRKEVKTDRIESTIIELKHPNILLRRKELDQVKTYMGVIRSTPQFNGNNRYFNFYLIGRDFHSGGEIDGELENAKHHGEKSLAYKEGNYKIYVKKWDEIFADFECKHNFVLKKLELNQEKIAKKVPTKTVEELVVDLNANSAKEEATWSAPRSPIGAY